MLRIIGLRNINVYDSEHTAKAHDVQIRSQADTFTAKAAMRSAKAHDVQLRSHAETPTAQAATRTAKARGAQIRSRAETPATQAGAAWKCDFLNKIRLLE